VTLTRFRLRGRREASSQAHQGHLGSRESLDPPGGCQGEARDAEVRRHAEAILRLLERWGAAMKIRYLPRWPPRWTSVSGGVAPDERAGVLRSVGWRVDLQGERDLRLTIEHGGHLWSGLYPDDAETRRVLGEGRLDMLHRRLTAHIGQAMARIIEFDV
jgi:hypothetical protein